jgi:hypothetical protein
MRMRVGRLGHDEHPGRISKLRQAVGGGEAGAVVGAGLAVVKDPRRVGAQALRNVRPRDQWQWRSKAMSMLVFSELTRFLCLRTLTEAPAG